jgi:hypothetical protein
VPGLARARNRTRSGLARANECTRRFGFLGAWLALVAACLPARNARADDMDLALSRLSRGACARTLAGAEDFALRSDGAQVLTPDNDAFARLSSQLSAAAAPALLAPVTTGGPSGFDVAFETSVTGLDHGASYWTRGSEGNSGIDTCDGRNSDVSSALALSRLRFTKGLPLGLSLGASIGRLYTTSLWTLGAELKLAILEGLTQPWAPALAVRVASSSVIGDAALSLNMFSADVILSKEWLAGRALKLAPYLGLGLVYGRARSATIDLTPNIDALACSAGEDRVCNAQGLGASSDDLGHDVRFAPVNLLRQRGFVGLWARYGLFALAAEFMLDLMQPRAEAQRTPRQWSAHVAPSLAF